MNQLLCGALTMAAWVAGLFFFRFWRVSGDRLFLFFLLAFWSLALNWLGLALLPAASESRHGVFLLRLLAFALIIAGVVDKNRRSHDRNGGDTHE
ncbi:MAG: DUF5985 family protein [Deltaproteobacteria bacterium]